MTYDEANRVAYRCRDMERALTKVGMHELALEFNQAFLTIEELLSVLSFSQFEDARRAVQAVNL